MGAVFLIIKLSDGRMAAEGDIDNDAATLTRRGTQNSITVIQPGPFEDIRKTEASSGIGRVESLSIIRYLQSHPIDIKIKSYFDPFRVAIFDDVLRLFLHNPEQRDFFTLAHLFQLTGRAMRELNFEQVPNTKIQHQIVNTGHKTLLFQVGQDHTF